MRARSRGGLLLGVALALSALAAGSGCGGSDDDAQAPLHTRCDLPHTGRELAGEWTLSAHGTRRRCKDASFAGTIEIETAMPIDVLAVPQSADVTPTKPAPDTIADAFVQRIERAEFVVGLAEGAPDGLSLEGGTVGSCVSLTLSEQLGGGDTLVYDLDGALTEADLVEGDLTGEGPAGCSVEGTFELLIR